MKKFFEKNVQLVKDKWIYLFAYFYLFLSVSLFLLGNVKYFISIPFTFLLFLAVIKAVSYAPDMKVSLLKKYKTMGIILFIIVIWVLFGGVGGFVWQNIWDHKFRNAIFRDLVHYSWPVIQDGKALCYYFGFWLPSALFGKLFGLQAGYFFQVIWAILGIFIAFGIICQYLEKVKIRNIILFVFYSGLDVFLFLIFSKLSWHDSLLNIMNGKHIELATTYFNSSSNTTLLFWLYNQIIPFWVGMSLLLQQKDSKSIILIYALMMLYSPFPLVALAPIILYFLFRKQKGIEEKHIVKNIVQKIKYACTMENIVAFFLIIIIGLFMQSNIAVNKIHILSINGESIIKYLCYIFFEFVIYLLFIIKKYHKDPILLLLILVTFFLPFLVMGNSYDFAWRTCIPLSFYIMLLIMKFLDAKDVHRIVKMALVMIFCLGAITPLTEMVRTVKNEMKVIKGEIQPRSEGLSSVFIKDQNACYDNFIGNTDSLFYKYIAK